MFFWKEGLTDYICPNADSLAIEFRTYLNLLQNSGR
jgi:hypothetical protein